LSFSLRAPAERGSFGRFGGGFGGGSVTSRV
jgi:hypothetical protein